MEGSEVICFGEILWDNLKNGRRLGGAPLNVCYHLSKFGVSSKVITQIGNDEDGRALLNNLNKLGIDTGAVAISNSKPTSTVEVHLKEHNEVRYEIVEDVAWDHINYTEGLGDLVGSSQVFVFGSLIARCEVSRETLYKLVHKSKFRVFDVNLRAPFYSKELIMSLLKTTNLLKLNKEELVEISGWLDVNLSDTRDRVKGIQNQFPEIEEILLTRGHKGAVYIHGNEWIEVPAYPVEVEDTVGSGDSFLAAFIAARIKGISVTKALERASVLSGFVATKNGACPEYDLEDLEKFEQYYRQPEIKKNHNI